MELVLGNEKEGLVSLEINLDRRLPVSEQVYGVLRDSIIRVKLFPGSPISENSICRQFSVSRTPVRAALQRLSEEGLVDIFPQQGTFVSKIRVDDIKDSHFVRRSLEVAVLRDVGSRWTRETSRTFRDLVDIQAADVRRNDVDAFLASDERFHQAFSVHARKEGVWSVIKAAKMPMLRFYWFFGTPQRMPIVLEEHLTILDALDEGDMAKAEAAMITHLDKNFVMFEKLPVKDRAIFAS